MLLRGYYKKDLTKHYEGVDLHTGQPVPHLYIAVEPDWNGRCVSSKAARCISLHLIMTRSMESMDRADRRNATTPMIILDRQVESNAWAFRELNEGDQALFGGVGETPGDILAARTSGIDDALQRKHEQLVGRINATPGVDTAFIRSRLDRSGKIEAKDGRTATMQLPSGLAVGSVTYPAPSGSGVVLLERVFENICITFGVPSQYLHRSVSIRSDDRQDQQRLQRSAQVYNPDIRLILIESISVLLEPYTSKRRRARQSLRGPIDVTLKPPLPPIEDLLALHQQGMLPGIIIQERIAHQYGFDARLFQLEPGRGDTADEHRAATKD